MNKNLIILGHRGKGPTSNLSKKQPEGLGAVPEDMLPENTLASFEKALQEGADGIELDVFISKDGVPMVIHDNELNRNVEGANRNARDLGMLEDYDLNALKKLNVGQGHCMPTLEEVFELVARYNKTRELEGKQPLTLNIELKGGDSAEPTTKMIKTMTDPDLTTTPVPSSSIMICSFNYDTLRAVRELDKDVRIAPSIKTTLLYGAENVDAQFNVMPGAIMSEQGLAQLRDLHDEIGFCAFDAVLWDIEQPLIDLAIECGISLCASTSDFRATPEQCGAAYNQFLVDTARQLEKHDLELYFKSDEPGLMREEIEKIDKASSQDLSEAIVTSSETLLSVSEDDLKRLPKPSEFYSTSYLQTISPNFE